MLSPSTMMQCRATGSNGARTSNIYIADGRFEFVCMSMQYGTAPIYVGLVMWDNPISGIYADSNVDTDNYHEVYDNRLLVSLDGSASDVTRSGNGGGILAVANLYKDVFFDGVTQTDASIFAWLQEKYGNYNYFKFLFNQNPPFLYDPYNRVKNISAVSIGSGVVSAVDYPMDPESEHVTFTGASYPGVDTYPAGTTNKPQYVTACLVFSQSTGSELIFDVYVDGSKDPNVFVKWREGITADEFSVDLVSPQVWAIPKMSSTPPPYVKSESGRLVPDTGERTMRGYSNEWDGYYAKAYLSEFSQDTAGMSTIDKIAEYGIDGIADQMCYYFRFNKQRIESGSERTTWGDLVEIRVPREVDSVSDIYDAVISNSNNDPEFTTYYYIHLGQPDTDIPDDTDEYPDGTDSTGNDPGVYDPDTPPHDFSTSESTGFSGRAQLTKTYALTDLRTQNVGGKLWTQSYFNVLKIQNNPIENIVSMKWFPFSVAGTDEDIVIGDVNLGIQGAVCDSIYKFTIGSVYYYASDRSNPSFLDMSPFTTIKLHLPYCGIVQLDATEMLNRKITVKYAVDLVSGDCMAFIYLDDNIPYMNVAGHCGVDIPLTSTNRVQTEMRAASTTISAVTGAAAHMVSGDLAGAAMDAAQGALSIGGMDYTSQRTSSHSPACTSTGNRGCYLEIFRPAYKESSGFKSRHGYPCHLYKKLGSFTGFVKCDARTKIDFAMTRRENEMVESLLTEGVYI